MLDGLTPLFAAQLQQPEVVLEQFLDVALEVTVASGLTWFHGMRANTVPIAHVLVRPENTNPAPMTIGNDNQ